MVVHHLGFFPSRYGVHVEPPLQTVTEGKGNGAQCSNFMAMAVQRQRGEREFESRREDSRGT